MISDCCGSNLYIEQRLDPEMLVFFVSVSYMSVIPCNIVFIPCEGVTAFSNPLLNTGLSVARV